MTTALPPFSLPASDGKTYTEHDFQDGTFVLYAYPRDMTSGCTLEAQQFQNFSQSLKTGNSDIRNFRGLSQKHASFCEKNHSRFLLADEKRTLLADLDILKEKSMYGKTYLGIDRSTFIIQMATLKRMAKCKSKRTRRRSSLISLIRKKLHEEAMDHCALPIPQSSLFSQRKFFSHTR